MRYIRPRMTGSHSRRRSWLTAAALATVLLPTGCGGSPRQDASEPKGTYKLEVAAARFPSSQAIAESSTMSIRVRNADTKAAPNVAVTVETDAEQARRGHRRLRPARRRLPPVRPRAPDLGRRQRPLRRRLRGHQHLGARPPQGRRDQGLPLEGHRRRARLLHDQVPHLPRPHRPRPPRLRRPHRRLLQGRHRRQAGPRPRRRRRQRRPRRSARRLQGLAAQTRRPSSSASSVRSTSARAASGSSALAISSEASASAASSRCASVRTSVRVI